MDSPPTAIRAPANANPQVLVIMAHPQLEHSRVNRRLLDAAVGVAARSEGRIVVRDLYALYPDYLIDVTTEQKLLSQARLVVWQHPIHWYHMPPLMKLWVDEVLGFGWAYGPGGTALQGKGPVAPWPAPAALRISYQPQSYNRYFFDAFLPPYEQTSALCGNALLCRRW